MTGRYATPAWKAQRKRVAERSGGVCERCHTNPARHVHHLYYPKGPLGNEPLSWLQHVCYFCHEHYHPGHHFSGMRLRRWTAKQIAKRKAKRSKRKGRGRSPAKVLEKPKPVLRSGAVIPMKRLGRLDHNQATDWMFYSQLRAAAE